MEYLLLLPILIPFIAAPICFALGRGTASNITAFLAALLSVGTAAFLMASGNTVFVASGVYPFSLKIDGFRATQLVVTAVVWLITNIFGREYFEKTQQSSKSYNLFTMLTLGAVVGVFLSNNLLTMFIFFEIMSLASYPWVVASGSKKAMSAGATYLCVSVVAGMISLMGLFLLNNLIGTLELAQIASLAQGADKSALYLAGGLTLVGFAAKAGLYPLHIWLPKAYLESPAPATAMLSGVLSKAGVFGAVALSLNVFSQDVSWGKVILVLALLTMLWGGLCALFSNDMKTTFAYSSMSQIGFIFFGISMSCIFGGGIAQGGFLLHMLNHSAVKLVLFTLCGTVLMNTGTTLLSKIKGYGRNNPLFAVSFVLAALGLSGLPLFSGYISKTLLHESIVEYNHTLAGSSLALFTAFEWAFLVAGGLTVAYLIKIALVLFAKPKEQLNKSTSPLTKAVVLIPCVYIVAVGVLPSLTADNIMGFAGLKVHGVNYFIPANLSGSLISILIGVIIFTLYKFIVKGRQLKPKYLLSLESHVYKPIIFKVIPSLLGVVCAFLDKYILQWLYLGVMLVLEVFAKVFAYATDTLAELLVMVGFKPVKEKDLGEKRVPATYHLGSILDKTGSVIHKRPKNGGCYADALSKYEEQAAIRRRMISSSLSYGLFFAGIGLIIVLIYLVLN